MTAAGAFFQRKLNNGTRRVIGRSAEFRRVEALPRRNSYPDVTELFTLWLRTNDLPTPRGVPAKLRLIQAWALWEAAEYGGVVGNLGVGVGKTLISYLLPTVMQAQRPMLLVPGNLGKKTARDFAEYAPYWRGHPNIRIVTYQTLSRVSAEKLLDQIVPDLIIADEVHFLKNTQAGCTRRVKRWMDAHPDTKFVGLSGTVTKRSVLDYAHLLKWGLKPSGMPLPNSFSDLVEWANALDEGIPDDIRPDPGALWTFCAPGETPRMGFRRRLLETPGVVASESPLVKKSDGADVALNIIERIPASIPQTISNALRDLRLKEQTPDGDEIVSALEMAARAREILCGWFYRWDWPVVTDLARRAEMGHTLACGPRCNKDHVWLDRRKAWKKFARTAVKNSQHSLNPLDTEQQVALAVINGALIDLDGTYANWCAVRTRWDPEKLKQAVWLSDYLVADAERWVRACQKVGHKGIVWAESLALLAELHKRMPDVPFYPSGDDRIMDATETCIAAMSHKTGKNLQNFHANLVLEVSTSGNDWEQLLGRTHRSGQESDEVTCEVYLHGIDAWDAFDQARRDASYVEETWKQTQRLSYATIVASTEAEVLARARSKDPLWYIPK